MNLNKGFSFIFGLLVLVSIFVIGSPTSAASIDDPLLKEKYQELVNQGIIDPSFDYTTWATAYLEGLEMEAEAAKESEELFDSLEPGELENGVTQVVRPAYTQMKAGDIFVTSDAYGGGIVGHAGIAISSTAILMMRGEGYSSYVMSYAQWKANYNKNSTHTWIYRHDNATAAQKAADWARKNYWHYNGGGTQIMFPKYKIHNNLSLTDPSYCSLLVWQAYHKTSPSYVRTPATGFVSPYSLRTTEVATSVWKVKPKLIATVYN